MDVLYYAIQGFVDRLQKATFPSPPAIQASGLPALTLAGLSPASTCDPSLGAPVSLVRSQLQLSLSLPFQTAKQFLHERPPNTVPQIRPPNSRAPAHDSFIHYTSPVFTGAFTTSPSLFL